MDTAIDLLSRAVRLHQDGALDAAAPLYRAALDRDADNPSALYLYGLLGLRQGRMAQAGDCLARADALRPRHAGTLAALAELRLRAGAVDEALGLAEDILAVVPRHAPALFLRGSALARLGRPAAAVASLRAALAVTPTHAGAHLNLANALLDLDDPAEAETHARAAAALERSAEMLAGLGHVLTRAGKYAEAASVCAKAIALRPDHAEAHWNRGIAALLAGDWPTGWAEYEWRKRHPRHGRDFRSLATPEWHGEDLRGGRLLILAEQGFGDAIQFARYAAVLRTRGVMPLLECAAGLVPLLSSLMPCTARGEALPAHDAWVDQMSLPHILGVTPETVPLAEGYLTADPALVARWAGLLPAGRRIGLVWAGNPLHTNDCRRSLPVGLAAALEAPLGACFVGLQVGMRAGEAATIPGLVDVSGWLTDWAQTAAAIANLDVLVTVDTAVAHCAGALGVPVWLMLPDVPDWRWLPGRDDTPWYRSMRLFRQPAPGDWGAVLREISQGFVLS
jgi:tetratricopeptide (TPR) repeat protein